MDSHFLLFELEKIYYSMKWFNQRYAKLYFFQT